MFWHRAGTKNPCCCVRVAGLKMRLSVEGFVCLFGFMPFMH